MPIRIAAPDLQVFIERLFRSYGVDEGPAMAVARNMVWSELVGRRVYGVDRIPLQVKRLRLGVLEGRDLTNYRQISASAGHLDGGGGFGQHVAEVAMNHAIALARDTGVGAVAVCNSSTFNAGGYYVNMAAEAGMIGLATCNSVPHVTPHGGRKAVLGTNPFAFGAPRRDGRHLLVDMATSVTAGTTVLGKISRGEPIPEGTAIDGDGKPVTDPAKMAGAVLLPFGGAKGFGLSLMVEILSGVITGAGVSHGVASMFNDFTRRGNNGHFLLALDIRRWISLDEYYARFDGLIAAIKASGENVLLPGEVRWQNYRDSIANGVAVDPVAWAEAISIAVAAGIEPPRSLA